MVTVSGNNASRVFFVNSNATISSLTITGGAADTGGGIYNAGTLTVDHSTLSGNAAGVVGSNGAGGGIYNSYGSLTVESSVLSGNSTSNSGGGIFNTGTVTVDNSTLSDNTAYQGGGMLNGASMTVQHSTLSGNSASYGGGISIYGTLTVDSSTFSGNSAGGTGGGIYMRGTSTLYNTIVAANFGQYAAYDDIDGAVASSSSHNLIGVATNLSGISHGSNGNLVGTAATPINPMLDALQNNGGPTATMALLPGSPAFNAGDNGLIPTGVITDQRGVGYARIDNATVDIGAYELIVNRPPTAAAGGPYSVTEGGSVVLDGSGSSDRDQAAETLIYDWDFDGDGQFDDATGISPTFSAAGLDGPTSV